MLSYATCSKIPFRRQSNARFYIILLTTAVVVFLAGCLFLTNIPTGPRLKFSRNLRPDDAPMAKAKSTKVVFFVPGFENEINRMKKGGAGGELRLFRSMMTVMRSLSNVELHLINDLDRNSEHTLRSADVIVSDQYRIESLQSVVPDAISNRSMACKLRFVDFWGTPPEQNHIHLNLKQFLVPYPNAWNEFLGFFQPLISRSGPNTDRRSILLHGKLGRYFRNHLGLIQRLTSRYEVVSTVPSQQLDGLVFPAAVRNLGICNSTHWERLLSASSAVIGFGDPVLAPTALESIAAGCPYVFARYAQPRALPDLPAHPIGTQHDFMSSIGPPYAYAVDISDADDVLRTLEIAIQNEIKPWIPEPFTADAYHQRLQTILDTDLC